MPDVDGLGFVETGAGSLLTGGGFAAFSLAATALRAGVRHFSEKRGIRARTDESSLTPPRPSPAEVAPLPVASRGPSPERALHPLQGLEIGCLRVDD